VYDLTNEKSGIRVGNEGADPMDGGGTAGQALKQPSGSGKGSSNSCC
jgi:hypothetical protein